MKRNEDLIVVMEAAVDAIAQSTADASRPDDAVRWADALQTVVEALVRYGNSTEDTL